MLKLSAKWAQTLISQPETGMGYQIVSIILRDGVRYDQAIIESGYIARIRGLDHIPFSEEDIAQIIVTHEKWKW